MKPLAVALAAFAFVAVGCGSVRDARRRQVNAYIARVNELEGRAAGEWQRVQNTYASIGGGHLTPERMRALAKARTTIVALRRRVAALPSPKDARGLRAKLLRLLDADAEVAAELAEFGRYIRAVTPLEQRVASATKALQSALRATKTRSGEERVLEAYVSQLGEVIKAEAQLKAPPALAPWQAEQDRRVRRLRAGATELGNGLAVSSQVRVTRGLNELRNAVSQRSVTPADREAIIAYNARVIRVRKLAAAVGREQNRLTREFT